MKIDINGFEMNYEIEGPSGAPVVIMSHSLGADLTMWEPQMSVLKDRFRVLRFDTRGHGGSGAPGDAYAMEDLASDLKLLLDGLEIERAHLVGLSMGGMIGQVFALRHPEMLSSLVLCDTAARGATDSGAVEKWEQRIHDVRSNGMEDMANQAIPRWFTGPYIEKNLDLMERVQAMIRRTSPDGYVGCARAIMGYNVIDRLSEIHLPALIIVGEEDVATPVESARVMHEGIVGSELKIIPSASHLSNIEQAEIFNRSLLDFLGRV